VYDLIDGWGDRGAPRHCTQANSKSQGDHLSGNVREFNSRRGNVRDFSTCQGNVMKKIFSGKSCLKLFIVSCIFASMQVFSTSMGMIWVTLNMPSGVEECGELSGNFTLFGDTLKSVAVAAAERRQLVKCHSGVSACWVNGKSTGWTAEWSVMHKRLAKGWTLINETKNANKTGEYNYFLCNIVPQITGKLMPTILTGTTVTESFALKTTAFWC